MKVRMKFQITGTRNGVRWPLAGGVVAVSDGEGADLISEGYAVAVEPEVKAVAKPEKAVARKAEKRG